jgi:acetyl esterase
MEAYQSTQYLYSNAANYGIDNKRFAVAGNSSGGNFAALVANKARYFHSINLAAQFLINPRTDVSLTSGGCTDYEIFEKQDIMLSKEDSLYFRNYYLPDTMDPRSPEISPYYDDLKGLPSTTLFAGEFDALRGDTEIYAEKLIAAGVKTKKLIGKGQTHSTMTARKVLSDGIDPAILIGKAIREELNPSYKPSE